MQALLQLVQLGVFLVILVLGVGGFVLVLWWFADHRFANRGPKWEPKHWRVVVGALMLTVAGLLAMNYPLLLNKP